MNSQEFYINIWIFSVAEIVAYIPIIVDYCGFAMINEIVEGMEVKIGLVYFSPRNGAGKTRGLHEGPNGYTSSNFK